MKNINVTRTINTATITTTVYHLDTEKVEKKSYIVATTQKLKESDIIRDIESADNTVKVLKVNDISYESALYEMSLDDFITYANKVGAGRKTL